MTSHVARLYALAAAILVFFVAWAAIAAHPWQTHRPAARIRGSRRFNCASNGCGPNRSRSSEIVDKRWAAYRASSPCKHERAPPPGAQDRPRVAPAACRPAAPHPPSASSLSRR